MRNLVIRALPSVRLPFVVRYGAAFALVALAFLSRLALEEELRLYPLLLYVPVVFVTALLLGRGAAFFATCVSALAVFYTFAEMHGGFVVAPHQLLPLALFLAVGFGISLVVDALRFTVAELEDSERRRTLLFHELEHRSKNDMMMLASILRLQALNEPRPEAQAALRSAVARVDVAVAAQRRLREGSAAGSVDIGGYVQTLCAGLGDLLRGVRPIAVVVHAEQIELPASQAVTVGLIANELVTNALKYAFPGDRPGSVSVELGRRDGQLVLVVSDDGVGCPETAPAGLGSRLIQMLAAGMRGRVERARPDSGGCRVEVRLSLSDR